MHGLSLVLGIVGAYLVLSVLPLGLISFWLKRQARYRRSPLTQMLLRGPGESLRNKLEEANVDLLIHMLLLAVVPLLAFAIHVSQSYFLGGRESIARTAIVVLFALTAVGFFFSKIYKLSKKIKRLRQGYEAEVAVAQELNQLMRLGAFVFHDVPGEGFNIDHVIVSTRGVYAVETKSRMKPNRDRGNEDAKVVFDGQCLLFPGWSETRPLEQADRQAKWIARWLSKAVGEKIAAKPVLALPGWYVDLKGKGEVVIINGKSAAAIFGKLSHATLSEEMVNRIAYQLEERCRDVEPKHFYRREKSTP